VTGCHVVVTSHWCDNTAPNAHASSEDKSDGSEDCVCED
jgi:hypothetical protein